MSAWIAERRALVRPDGDGGAYRDGPLFISLLLLSANFVGVAFARTLHFQFLSWYWFSLPLRLRNWIWATFKPGQEVTLSPSAEYMKAATAVQQWINAGGTKTTPLPPGVP
jgi:hypothetical protein